MPLSNKSLAGPGYIILNVLRVMNIVGLLAIVTASIVMLVKTFIVSKFFFFDACSHVITAFVAMFLTLSELSLFKNYFAQNWPLLSPKHGFVGIGLAMLVIGVNTLGNLNKAATSQESLGLAFWRIVIGSGIIVLVLGFFNIIASFVFRDTSLGLTARNVRAHGAVADSVLPTQEPFCSGSPSNYTSDKKTPQLTVKIPSSVYSRPVTSPTKSPKTPFKGFSPVKAFRAARDSLPSYSFKGLSPTKTNKDKDIEAEPLVINISSPIGVNPQFAHLVKQPPKAKLTRLTTA